MSKPAALRSLRSSGSSTASSAPVQGRRQGCSTYGDFQSHFGPKAISLYYFIIHNLTVIFNGFVLSSARCKSAFSSPLFLYVCHFGSPSRTSGTGSRCSMHGSTRHPIPAGYKPAGTKLLCMVEAIVGLHEFILQKHYALHICPTIVNHLRIGAENAGRGPGDCQSRRMVL